MNPIFSKIDEDNMLLNHFLENPVVAERRCPPGSSPGGKILPATDRQVPRLQSYYTPTFWKTELSPNPGVRIAAKQDRIL
jgi:hypothetical protein